MSSNLVVRYPNGRETSVSLRDVVPCNDVAPCNDVDQETATNNQIVESHIEQSAPPENNEGRLELEPPASRRSNRTIKHPTRMNL